MEKKSGGKTRVPWLLFGFLILLFAWIVAFRLEDFRIWNPANILMKSVYLTYAIGFYFFIKRLGVRRLDYLWGIFCMLLLINLMTELSIVVTEVTAMLTITISIIGMLVITLGIFYAGQEWERKNRSLRKEVDERKTAQTQLRKRTVELEDALKKSTTLEEVNRLKSQFLSIASHELRTPITPIIVQIEMMLKQKFGKLSKDQKKSLEMVLRDTKRLDRLIQDILDLSRLQISGMKFSFRKNDLNDVITETVEMIKSSSEDKKVSIEFSPGKIKPFIFDRDRITQVMTDLLNNAVKFTPMGGRVEVSTRAKGNDVVVIVRDSGIGIAAEDMKKLFKPFSQIESSMKYKGTGLGLSICKGVVENHDGSIRAESEGRGKGASFIFTLPMNKHRGKSDGKQSD